VAVIWETVDRLGRRVVLTEAGWAHILDRHDDMVERQLEIRSAIELADEIRRDARFARHDVHYAEVRTGPLFIRVVVRYRPDTSFGWVGEVVTAHMTGRKKAGELVRWP
jgi:hypothetical protein